MKERYRGTALIEALLRQDLLTCDSAAAQFVSKRCSLVEYKAGQEFIRQGSRSSDVFLILQGIVDIFVSGRYVATRAAGQHVGEMAPLLNSSRTASARARESVVAAKLSRSAFLALGKKYSSVWKEIARVLALRLDQRRNLIREPNMRPKVFIASASESKQVAITLKALLEDPKWECEAWFDEGVFAPSKTFIQVLEEKAKDADFAVAIFDKDDVVISRKRKLNAPRDNVIFEAGLFVGALGLARTYVLLPTNTLVKWPSDLNGVVTLRYERTTRKIDLAQAAKEIRKCIEKYSVR